MSIQYELSYKKIKNINLKISPQAQVQVSAPIGLNKEIIDAFVQSKAQWIERNLEKRKKANLEFENSINDNKCLYLGAVYDIKYDAMLHCDYVLDKQAKTVSLKNNKHARAQFYKTEATIVFQEILNKQLPLFSKYKLKPDLTHRQMSRRWGTCYYTKNKIVMNTKLIQVPPTLIELVITHELVHFIHHDHQKGFYKLFDEVLEDRKEKEQKLNDYAYVLSLKFD